MEVYLTKQKQMNVQGIASIFTIIYKNKHNRKFAAKKRFEFIDIGTIVKILDLKHKVKIFYIA